MEVAEKQIFLPKMPVHARDPLRDMDPVQRSPLWSIESTVKVSERCCENPEQHRHRPTFLQSDELVLYVAVELLSSQHEVAQIVARAK